MGNRSSNPGSDGDGDDLEVIIYCNFCDNELLNAAYVTGNFGRIVELGPFL